jgi:predicted permease
MAGWVNDLRHVVRRLGRRPGVVSLAAATLALGIGLNTAAFAVAYGVLWRPLVYPDAGRLVTINALYHEDEAVSGFGPDRFRAWVERLRVAALAGHETRERSVRGAGPARIARVATVTERFFDVLGVPAAAGVAPPLPAGDPRAVVSARLAASLGAAPAAVVGLGITIGDAPYTVAGVMPSAFTFPTPAVDVWIPVPPAPPVGTSFDVVGRLTPGATVEQARDDAARVVRDVHGDDWRAAVVPLEAVLLDAARPALTAALAAAMLVLLAACANAMTLLVGWSMARRREFAVRLALGVGLRRLYWATFAEGLVVAAAGLAAGSFLAWAAVRLFATSAAAVLPRAAEIRFDHPMLLAAAASSLVAAVVCGTASTLGMPRGERLGPSGVAGPAATPTARRLRAALVVAQVSTAVVLLTGAGLLARSMDALLVEDGGFDSSRVLVAKLMLGDSRFADAGASAGFVDRLLAEVRRLPGVDAAGLGSLLPPTDAPTTINLRFRTDTRDDTLSMSFGAVTPGFFEALGTPLHAGRRFDAADERVETPDVVVSASTARFLYPDADAVGRGPRFALERFGIVRESTVQGVVADMKYAGLEAGPASSIYVPWRHRPMGLAHLVVRTAGDPSGLLSAVRDLILSLNPGLPVPEVRTLDDHVADSIAGRRLQLVPAAALGGLALLVAMVGTFGALSRSVTERRRELAIRAAIGASPDRLVRLVMRGSLALGAVGVAVGLAGAAGIGRGLSSLLYGVGPYDAATFAAVAGSVLAATLVASLLPARRAARVDPLMVLKGD